MNQAIQVLDGFSYTKSKKALKIEVIVAGQTLACFIIGESEESLTELYHSKQFEIEEVIEREIAQDKVNSDGEIWLTAQMVEAY